MKTLITIRDSIKEFVSKYEKFVMPVIKFIATLLVLISFSSVMGYSTEMKNPVLMFIISLIGAFLPIQLTVLMAGLVGAVHMYAVSLEVAAVYAGVFILMYLLYLRFAPKYGWLVILMPLFYMLKLHYMVPIIVGIFIGPVGIVPTAFGVIFYYFTRHVKEYVDLMASVSEEGAVQGFSYILNGLLQNKPMLLTVIVFAIVILATYIIYRQSFQYSWMIAIGAGAVLSIVLFLMGGIVLEADIDILIIFLGTVIGALLSVVVQFFKGILDYSRTENVQFEDDEYYYYVKAVPKIRVAEQNVKVKKINEKQSNEKGVQSRTNVQPKGNSQNREGVQPAGSTRNRAGVQAKGSAQSRTNVPPRGRAQENVQTGSSQVNYTSAQRQTQKQVYNATREQVENVKKTEQKK